MKAFRVQGTLRAGKDDQAFTIDVVAEDEDDARHRTFSNFGSRHRVPRRFINIETLEEINPSESNAPTVNAHFRD
jgi:large subunit ribosomal protein LX